MTEPLAVHLVPHTHWDREWYEPFQRFRLRLVDLVATVLDLAEADPDFRFTFDGQLAAIDDFLEVRPEETERVSRLVRAGQLAVGPWRVLADEFLCSGENLVRNLELGWRRAEELGGVMAVGYLPDQFGHCAQMPQILARAGLVHACLWRGVPDAVRRHAFAWRAPDGSTVRTEYLPDGYGNAAHLFAADGSADATGAEFVRVMRPYFGDDEVLAMFGSDHSAPLPGLAAEVRAWAERAAKNPREPIQPRMATLASYLASVGADLTGLPVHSGELRSHARANILPGVLSVRVQLKQAMAAAERAVERYAEPWAALYSADWPQRFLDMAWQRLVDSSCHDSVTGCGVDETAVQVAARIAEAEQLGTAMRDRTVAQLSAAVPAGAVAVLNPSPVPRTDWVELTVPVDEAWDAVELELPDGSRVATQELGRPESVLTEESVPAERLPSVVDRTYRQEMFNRQLQRWSYADGLAEFRVGERMGEVFDPVAVRAELAAAAKAHPGEWTLRILDEPSRTLAARLPVPALGWTSVRPVAAAKPATATAAVAGPVTLTGDGLDTVVSNDRLRVEVAADGTLTLRGRNTNGTDGTETVLTGVGRITESGDRGDSYNYGPPASDLVVDAPSAVRARVERRGPLSAVLVVEREYGWPVELTADRDHRSTELAATLVTTLVELRAGEEFVRLSVAFDNRCTDHRVRLHVPLAQRAEHSAADGQFAVVERGLTSEGGFGETPVPTFPAYSFVAAGGAGVLLDHVTEYELVSGGTELALTLVRSTGWLSRNVHPYREQPAGPQLAIPAAQCRGEIRTELAVTPYTGDWSQADLADLAERYTLPLHTAPGRGGTGLALAEHTGLTVAGAGVRLSSLRRRDGELELRVLAQHPTATTARISGDFTTAHRCDLLGRVGEQLKVAGGVLELALGAWEIATVRLG